MGNLNNCTDNASANRYIPYASCLRLLDLTYWVDYYWDNYVVRYTEWALWNYVQKYVALGFCDWESTNNSTTECWGLAWIFRPLYELFLTFTFGSILWGTFFWWMITKSYIESSGLYNGIVEDVAKNNE